MYERGRRNSEMSPKPQARTTALAEALFEIRFQSSVHADFVVGVLASKLSRKDTTVHRLPLGEMPSMIRAQDPNLMFQPIMQLDMDGGARVYKISERGISLHCLKDYPLWLAFQKECEALAKTAKEALAGFTATRLGLRYVNLFTEAANGVSKLTDLPVTTKIANQDIAPPIHLTYRRRIKADLELNCVLASAEFLLNPPAPNITALADFDAYTPGNHHASTPSAIMKWVDRAHDAIKSEYTVLTGATQ
jgi:uncharacterized protein (TIGR04255 family)